jgi:hypothetical protein
MKTTCSLIAFSIFFTASATASLGADDKRYPSGVESVLSSISGIVAATQQNVELQRSVSRLFLIRNELSSQLAANFNNPTGTISFAGLSQTNLLCEPRGTHAGLAVSRSYLATTTTEIERVATPGEIVSLLDAVKVIFQNYSLEVAYTNEKTKGKLRDEVIKKCLNDVNILLATHYRAPVAATNTIAPVESLIFEAADRAQPGAAIEAFSLFQSLLDAINAIVNPIAKEIDRQKRLKVIGEFLVNWRTRISTTATSLADEGVRFANQRRSLSLGQYAEQLESIRRDKIAINTIDACKGIQSTDKAFMEVQNPSDATKKISIPTDLFLACYAGAWKKISEGVATILKASDEYDAFADAVSGKEVEGAKKLKAQIETMGENDADLKELWADALRLVAFGKMLNDAFSQEHRDKVKSAIDDLVKAF